MTSTDRLVRAAAWLYIAPRALVGFLILAVLGLGALVTSLSLALTLLRRLGA